MVHFHNKLVNVPLLLIQVVVVTVVTTYYSMKKMKISNDMISSVDVFDFVDVPLV